MSESRQIGMSLWRRPQKNLLQGNPVLRDRAKGAFSLLLSLEQTKKVRQIIFFYNNKISTRRTKSYSG
jgi:hypothetical protein